MSKGKITIAGVNSLFAQASGGYGIIRGSSTHDFVKLLLKELNVEFEDCPFDGDHKAVLWCGPCQHSHHQWGAGVANGYKSVEAKQAPEWDITVQYRVSRVRAGARSDIESKVIRGIFRTFDDAMEFARAEYPTATRIDIKKVVGT